MNPNPHPNPNPNPNPNLEQGCTWAHLASQSRTASDDAHWTGRRAHVFALVARLAEPLRAHALALKEP